MCFPLKKSSQNYAGIFIEEKLPDLLRRPLRRPPTPSHSASLPFQICCVDLTGASSNPSSTTLHASRERKTIRKRDHKRDITLRGVRKGLRKSEAVKGDMAAAIVVGRCYQRAAFFLFVV
ncbi:hypothetical protein HN51_011485, partial [Arachis hypogaea]